MPNNAMPNQEMPRHAIPMNAARALVATLQAHGIDRVFCVPGESFLAVLDALHDARGIQTVACRHESGAGFMAVADAKLTRRPGIAFVSRGPGACNASIAVHTAQQDAAPMVLFVGQIDRADRGRRAFQEVDYLRTFGDMAKWVVEVEHGRDLPGVAARALRIAQEGVPGPVVVSMPEDILNEICDGPADPEPAAKPPAPDASGIAEIAALLASARRPIVIAGSGVAAPGARQALLRFAEAWNIPVATSYRQQHLFPGLHPLSAGHLGFNIPAKAMEILAPADLVLAIGTRLGDVTTQGYRFPKAPEPVQTLIHVHAAAEALQSAYRPAHAVHTEPEAFLQALLSRVPNASDIDRAPWIDKVNGYARGLIDWTPVQADDGLVFGAAVTAFRKAAPDDAIVTLDAGNFSAWVHRYFPFGAGHELAAPVSGAMGFGVPSAVAAALRFPDRKVVCFVGDGGLLMTGNELATARQYAAAPCIIVSDNASYATIRQYQERSYPGRVIATNLHNPDLAAWARAFGVTCLRLGPEDDADEVMRRAMCMRELVIIHVPTSLKHISPYMRLPA